MRRWVRGPPHLAAKSRARHTYRPTHRLVEGTRTATVERGDDEAEGSNGPYSVAVRWPMKPGADLSPPAMARLVPKDVTNTRSSNVS
jgi:hypothetical protein